MLKKTIKYVGAEGKEVEDTFYFNLTKAEIVEIDLMSDIRSVNSETSGVRIIEVYKRIMKSAVGQRIGNLFEKSDSYANWFIASDAYSTMFMEIFESEEPEKTLMTLIRSMLPLDVQKAIEEQEDSEMTTKELVERSDQSSTDNS